MDILLSGHTLIFRRKPNTGGASKGRQSRIRFDTKRIIILLVLIACVVTVLVMGNSLSTEPTADGEEGALAIEDVNE